MRTITISISVPDGVEVRVSNGTTLDDFEHEPLPTETYAAEETFPAYNGAPVPQNGAPVTAPPVVRTMATEQPHAIIWQVGQVHAQGHKPLRSNKRGLFCPTAVGKKGDETIFCDWRP